MVTIDAQPITRLAVPFAVALLLTFGRMGMLPFIGEYTYLDFAMNVFVVLIAPFFALIGLFRLPLERYLLFLLPLLLLSIWIFIRVYLTSPWHYWPDYSQVITVLLAIMLASQISLTELRRVRHMLLLLSAIFAVLVLIYGQSILSDMMTGWMRHKRLGADISAGNLVAFPRVAYTLAFICLVTALIEKRVWLRFAALGLMVMPLAIAFATGGRGPLLGLVAAIVAFVLALRRKFRILVGGIVTVLLGMIAYQVVLSHFPILAERLLSGDDSGRLAIYREAIRDISLFGRGVRETYAHNVFLEFLQDYGVIGLLLFLAVLGTTLRCLWKAYRTSEDREVLWVIGVLVLQLCAQQLSLNIFWGFFWAAMVLPLGLACHEAALSLAPAEVPEWPPEYEEPLMVQQSGA